MSGELPLRKVEAVADRLAQGVPDAPEGVPCLLVRVIDAGYKPSTSPGVFAGRPVKLSAELREGGTVATSDQNSAVVLFVNLGRAVPPTDAVLLLTKSGRGYVTVYG